MEFFVAKIIARVFYDLKSFSIEQRLKRRSFKYSDIYVIYIYIYDFLANSSEILFKY